MNSPPISPLNEYVSILIIYLYYTRVNSQCAISLPRTTFSRHFGTMFRFLATSCVSSFNLWLYINTTHAYSNSHDLFYIFNLRPSPPSGLHQETEYNTGFCNVLVPTTERGLLAFPLRSTIPPSPFSLSPRSRSNIFVI